MAARRPEAGGTTDRSICSPGNSGTLRGRDPATRGLAVRGHRSPPGAARLLPVCRRHGAARCWCAAERRGTTSGRGLDRQTESCRRFGGEVHPAVARPYHRRDPGLHGLGHHEEADGSRPANEGQREHTRVRSTGPVGPANRRDASRSVWCRIGRSQRGQQQQGSGSAGALGPALVDSRPQRDPALRGH